MRVKPCGDGVGLLRILFTRTAGQGGYDDIVRDLLHLRGPRCISNGEACAGQCSIEHHVVVVRDQRPVDADFDFLFGWVAWA